MTIAAKLRQEGKMEGKLIDKLEVCLNLIEEGSNDKFIFKITGIQPKYLTALHKLHQQKGEKAKEYLEELLDI